MGESGVKLSIVGPIHSEAANLDEFFRRLLAVLEGLAVSYEVICVDDGSTDETLARLLEQRVQDPRIKILSLSRNFGKEVALSAGMEHSCGAAIIPIDCDLQDPPELIEEMMAQWRLGYDVVYATRHARPGDGLVKRLTASVFYRLFDAVSEVPIPPNAGDFRLLTGVVMRCYGSPTLRFMKGLFACSASRSIRFDEGALPAEPWRTAALELCTLGRLFFVVAGDLQLRESSSHCSPLPTQFFSRCSSWCAESTFPATPR